MVPSRSITYDLRMTDVGRTMPRLRQEIERVSSPFNQLVARQVGERIDLDVEGATFATWHPRYVLTGYSWDALCAACLLRPAGPPRRVLLLGLGGGTVLRQLLHLAPQATAVAVEIDSAVVELARRYMRLDDLQAEVVIEDAYRFVARCRRKFDVVIDDLFLTGPEDVERAAIPEGGVLLTMKGLLAPGGVFVANLITDTAHRRVRRATRRALLENFPAVGAVTPPRGLNEVLVAAERLAGETELLAYAEQFAEARDRRHWLDLRYTPLQPSTKDGRRVRNRTPTMRS